MHPVLRLLHLFCQFTILGLGVLMAVNELYGMAVIFAVMCWKDRPDVLRGHRIVKR